MLDSPRIKSGVRAFFIDMLQFDLFDTLAKDAKIYPKWTVKAAQEAQEQTLRTIVDLLLTQRGDYRDLFTTRKTFLTPLLGSIYRVPVAQNVAPWQPFIFPEGDPRAGIQSQASFVALHSHEGMSSPTLRGKALREVLLCEPIPAPPANVNFAVAQDTHNPDFKTMRDRLTAHRTDPTCAGCHKLMDPPGLALENFDSDAGYRIAENGQPLDTRGELPRDSRQSRHWRMLCTPPLCLRHRPGPDTARYDVDTVPREEFRCGGLSCARSDAAHRHERESLPDCRALDDAGSR
jgi:hypothetical protein